MRRLVADNAVTSLSEYVGSSDDILKVDDDQVFPDPVEDEEFFDVVLPFREKGREVDWETCRVTKREGRELHVERGAYGTKSRNWPSGTAVELRANAHMLGWIADGGEDRETETRYRLVVSGGDLVLEEMS